MVLNKSNRSKHAETFGAWAQKWLRGYQMADSTRDMRRSVYARELEGKFGNQKLTEITVPLQFTFAFGTKET